MAAPTVVYIQSTQDTGTTVPTGSSVNSPAVGDLCVITQGGVSTAGTATAPTYTSGGGDAGFVLATDGGASSNQANGGRCIQWWKVLVSGDFSSGNLKQFSLDTAGISGNHRATIWVFRHANGWDPNYDTGDEFPIGAITNQVANVSSGTNISLTDVPRPAVSVFQMTRATSMTTTQQVDWNDGTARDAYADDGTGTTTTGGHANHYGYNNNGAFRVTADYQEWDGSDTIASVSVSTDMGNNNHEILIVTYTTGVAETTGVGSASITSTLTSSGTRTASGTAASAVSSTLAATGTKTVLGTASLTVTATLEAQQQANFGVGTATITSTLTASGGRQITGVASEAVTSTLAASGTKTVLGTAVITSTWTAEAEQLVPFTSETAGGAWSSSSVLRIGGRDITGTAAAAITATLSATGTKVQTLFGLGNAPLVATIQATGTKTVLGTALLAITADLEATAFRDPDWHIGHPQPKWIIESPRAKWEFGPPQE